MRANAPGRFRHGVHGPAGRTNGHGTWWEPDMFPLYDLLNDPPTLREVRDLRTKRASLPTNTVDGFKLLATGGVCTTEKVYRMSMFRHRLEFNGTSYNHAAVVRGPAYGSVPPANGEYPILLLLHGNITDAMRRNKITDWDRLLAANKFYTDQCVVVFPLYFGYRMELPESSSYGVECEESLHQAGYPKFNGQSFETLPVDDPLFKSDYLAEGFSADDVQIMAILQAVTAVRQRSPEFGVSLNGDIGLLGGSLGASMVYKVAPVLHDNGLPATLKATIAL